MDDAEVCGNCGISVPRGIETCPACGASVGGKVEDIESTPAERVPQVLPRNAARRPLGGRMLLLGVNLALLAVCAVLSATQYFFPVVGSQQGVPTVTATPLLSGSGTETAITGSDSQSVQPIATATATPRPHQSGGGGAPPTATVPAGPAPTATATRIPPTPTPVPTIGGGA